MTKITTDAQAMAVLNLMAEAFPTIAETRELHDYLRARLASTSPAPDGAGGCSHEPFQGRCIHCDVSFKDGRPVGQPVRCDAIPKHDWQELSCESSEYEPSMESGYKRCTRCGTRVHFNRERAAPQPVVEKDNG